MEMAKERKGSSVWRTSATPATAIYVLQALYFCEPLRYHLAQVREEDANGSAVIAWAKAEEMARPERQTVKIACSPNLELFSSISAKAAVGSSSSQEFLRTLQERNELFRGNNKQDAHEFFNFVLNDMADSLVARRKKKQRQRQQQEEDNKSLHHESSAHQAQPQPEKHAAPQAPSGHPNHQHRPQQQPRSYAWPKMHSLKGSMGNGSKIGPSTNGSMRFATSSAPSSGKGEDKRSPPPAPLANGASGGHGGGGDDDDDSGETWVHRIFQGVLTNETKCLCCETVSNRDEPFMDLSLDVEQNSSVTACLRSFSNTETLTKKNKFFCENCNALQEAEKKIQLKRLPRVLTLHLKRFKYVESLESFSKLSHRVVFPLELRAPNMTDGQGEADADGRLYRRVLFAVVVHIGRGPNHGHYVAVVKSGGRWLLFDDDIVELVNEEVLRQCYGLARPASTETNTGYLLLYDCGKESGEPPPFGQER
ncbi:unnamed protein product [Ascophyllum nodosum]